MLMIIFDFDFYFNDSYHACVMSGSNFVAKDFSSHDVEMDNKVFYY